MPKSVLVDIVVHFPFDEFMEEKKAFGGGFGTFFFFQK
jgi:hypothetical protein